MAEGASDFTPHRLWSWNEKGGWEEVARMRIGGYFARVEDQDGDLSVWVISKDHQLIAEGEFTSQDPYHYDLALQAAENKLRELGVLT